MADKSIGNSEKAQILQEVYEDNVRIRHRQPRGSLYTARPYVTGIGGVAVLVLIILAAANFVFQDEAPRISDNSDAILTAASAKVAGQAVQAEAMQHDGDIPPTSAYESIGASSASLAELFDLEIHTIVIDAGHGGADPGSSGPSGTREKEITLDVATRLRRRLNDGYGYRVLMTRDKDSTLTLRGRADYSNENGADLFVSIHVNSFPDPRVVALETYYFGPKADDSSLRLAEVENQNSDYGVAEFNRMVRQMGDRIKLQESRKIARYVQRSLYSNTSHITENAANWGVKTAPFVVLVGAEAPGILAEIGAITNPESEAQLMTSEYREQLAMFLEEGIVNYLTERSHKELSINAAAENATEENATEEEEK
jgi:N-acetylmuramoyl-L-alanine amidase